MISSFKEGGSFSEIGFCVHKVAIILGKKIGDREVVNYQIPKLKIEYHVWITPRFESNLQPL